MTTYDTTELGLAFAVAAFGMPASTTALTGVGRIDKRYRYARALRLVADKRPELPEGQIAVSRSLPWPFNPRPRSDALANFKDDRPPCVFGFGNQPLTDVVIGVLLK